MTPDRLEAMLKQAGEDLRKNYRSGFWKGIRYGVPIGFAVATLFWRLLK